MASIIFEACKKMRKTDPFQFEQFPDMGSIKDLNYGPFREKIRLFLQEFAEKIEKDELPGWGHHFVSRRKYHLIIPEVDQWKNPLKDDFFDIRTHILYGVIHCNGYGHLICINGVKEESHFLSDSDIMNFWDRICSTLCTREVSVHDEINLRLLYVVAYGQSWYGKWGYKFSRGSFGIGKERYDKALDCLMSLDLDKIVTHFKNKIKGRKIKQIISKYRGMRDIPLITMSDLLEFMLGFGGRTEIQRKTEKKLIKRGRQNVLKISENEGPIGFDALVTSIANRSRWSARRVDFVLKEIVKVLKEKKGNRNEKYGVSRHEMRQELKKCIGDTGLIDCVLTSIRSFKVGNYVICRLINSSTRLLEFKIHEAFQEGEPNCRYAEERVEHASEVNETIVSRKELQNKDRECIGDIELADFLVDSGDNAITRNQSISHPTKESIKGVDFTIQNNVEDEIIGISKENVARDALYLYRNVLFGYGRTDSVTLSARDVVDSKHFVKEWLFEEQDNNQLMALSCKVLPTFDELEKVLPRTLSPGVVVAVPPSITIGELKVAAQSALRDTYCIMDNFLVRKIGGLKEIEDDKVVSQCIKPSDPVWVGGSGLDLGTKLRYEDGIQRLSLNCSCGTKYDDGERLAACKVCTESQHTRCSAIADNEDAPSDFLCSDCAAVFVRK
ncbi:hypothetical protein ACH5RR_029782 [Cinchona calisaya]|uniref:Zinc finger PHD-type domain-containing protein n=1 Tax=Cinchona calisaya TaxID=153742 RepID=A0ABD2YSM4_9GENT